MNPVLAAWPELANSLGGWEITLVLAVILILYGASHLPHRPEEARATRTPSQTLSRQDELILWLAQGLDAGRISVAPGTFGSLVGLLWFAVLLVPGSLNLYLLGTAAGLAASVWCCGRAEQILGRIDPPSVVLDEIAAVPICYLPWVVHESAVAMPQLEVFLAVTKAGCSPSDCLRCSGSLTWSSLGPCARRRVSREAGGSPRMIFWPPATWRSSAGSTWVNSPTSRIRAERGWR